MDEEILCKYFEISILKVFCLMKFLKLEHRELEYRAILIEIRNLFAKEEFLGIFA